MDKHRYCAELSKQERNRGSQLWRGARDASRGTAANYFGAIDLWETPGQCHGLGQGLVCEFFSWPPEVLASNKCHCRHDDGSNQKCVQQYADANNSSDLSQRNQRQHTQHGKHRSQQNTCGGYYAACRPKGLPHALPRPSLPGFFLRAAHKENAVVDAQSHQEQKGQNKHRHIKGWETKDVLKHEPACTNSGEERTHHRKQQHFFACWKHQHRCVRPF